jgi:uncharacterized protein YkwD
VAGTVGAPSADAAIKRSSKSSVATSYVQQFEPSQGTAVNWSGSAGGCVAGAESAASQEATLDAINYVRSLAGLSSVSLDPSLSAKAQEAALVYKAKGTIAHDIPSSWPCATDAAQDAGQNSNIAFGVAGARAITGYMDEPGASNTAAGHRRWILNPAAKTFGTGSTNSTHALWVQGARAKKGSFKNPAWVTWPTAGYFPTQLEPNGRWSISGAAGKDYDFSKAKVVVRDASGKKLSVKKYSPKEGYGSDTLVFRVAGVKNATGSSVKKYSVTVTGVKKGSQKVSHSYTVKIFKPAGSATDTSGARASVRDLAINGGLVGAYPVGQPLTATASTVGDVTVEWFLDRTGERLVTGATFTPPPTLSGETVTVRVTAEAESSTAYSQVSVHLQ